MEVIKYALIPMIWATSSVYVVCGLISFLVKKIQKKDVRKTKRRLIIAFLLSFIALAVIGSYDTMEENPESAGQNEAEVETTESVGIVETTSIVTDAVAMGETRDNPFVLTADELASEILDDIDAAKEKYNDKWIQITGTITDTSDGGIMYGYYLYGQRSTTGYTGLSIMCWCDDGPYSGSVIGDTQTFLGLMREVTTVNVTEIAECERISD